MMIEVVPPLEEDPQHRCRLPGQRMAGSEHRVVYVSDVVGSVIYCQTCGRRWYAHPRKRYWVMISDRKAARIARARNVSSWVAGEGGNRT